MCRNMRTPELCISMENALTPVSGHEYLRNGKPTLLNVSGHDGYRLRNSYVACFGA
jgi:hypothetical protein